MVVWPSGPRRWIKAPVSSGAWVRIPPLPVLSFVLATKALNIVQKKPKHSATSAGSVAERSKALDLGSSLCGGVGSNPTTAKDARL